MATYKKGATLQILLQFTPEEFDTIYPYDSLLAECENNTTEYQLTTTVDVATKTLLLTADTANFDRGTYKVDIRIEKDGIITFIPSDKYITFQIIPPVSEVASEVNTNAG